MYFLKKLKILYIIKSNKISTGVTRQNLSTFAENFPYFERETDEPMYHLMSRFHFPNSRVYRIMTDNFSFSIGNFVERRRNIQEARQ